MLKKEHSALSLKFAFMKISNPGNFCYVSDIIHQQFKLL